MRHRLIAPLGLVTALVVGGPALAQTADAAVDQASDASATVQDADSRAYASRLNILNLVEQGRIDEARAAFDADWAAGILPGPAPLDAANIAVSVGRDAEAQAAFRQADAQTPLSGATALNAGYSARRIGDDATAIYWFERGLDTWPTDPAFDDQRRFEIRREIETLQRVWGASASVSYGSTSTTSSGIVGADTVVQAGGEVYRRIGGYNNGRTLDVFGRVFTTLDSDVGGPTGGDTTQGWVGVRYRPLSETNLILEASRMIALGDLARDDWMLRAAWSAEDGSDLRFDRTSWPAWRLYGDVAHLVDAEQTLGVAEARLGRAWRTTDRDVVTPFVTVRGYYDSALADEFAAGAGPGVSWRHWFRERGQAAPASWIEFVLGYQFSLSGDARGEGTFIGVNLSY
ncbi:NfrA family protein [Brevundimonas aveniformis]|uniref:NfrA family protein n=1 Tax=Brevundimonas aveniformis TaxID=370977 RepID=UPI0003F55494|nr:hypothetical protein [Brevundimonas aveniformis]